MRKKIVQKIQKNAINQEKKPIVVQKPKDENQQIFDNLTKLLGKHSFSQEFIIKSYNDQNKDIKQTLTFLLNEKEKQTLQEQSLQQLKINTVVKNKEILDIAIDKNIQSSLINQQNFMQSKFCNKNQQNIQIRIIIQKELFKQIKNNFIKTQ